MPRQPENSHFQDLAAAGDQVVDVLIFRTHRAAALLYGLIAGEVRAKQVFHQLEAFAANLADDSIPCLFCGEAIDTLPAAFVLTSSLEPISAFLGLGLCSTCADRHDDHAVAERLAELPGARIILSRPR